MRHTDAFAWYLEEDPGLRSTILAVAWLDQKPDVAALTERLERATRLAPRFRQRPVEVPGRLANPRWVDGDFDLSWHLRVISAPAPATRATVLDFVRIEAMTGFDRSRPLWTFTLVEKVSGNRAALVMKVHHSLTDGIGGMQLAFLLFDLTGEAQPGDLVERPAPTHREHHAFGLVRDGLAYDGQLAVQTLSQGLSRAVPTTVRAARHPFRSACTALSTMASIGRFVQPVSDTCSPVMTTRSLDRHLDMVTVVLEDLKRAAASAGGTLNDAFLASLTGGLRRYHEIHGAEVAELRVTLPISIRREGDPQGGNRITLQRFTVPVDLADPGERLRRIGQRCRTARDDLAVPWSNAIAGTLNLLPSSVVAGMLKHIDFVASNVPGIGVPLFLAGAPVSGYFVFGPTTGSSMNATLLSYNGTCCVGFTLDAAAVPDGDVLIECMCQGFEEVLGLAGDHGRVERPLQGCHR
jgi:WS/DGAT/MGAT family acyltransferase